MLDRLQTLVTEGQIEEAVAEARQALESGTDARLIVDEALVPAMALVGERFERMEYYYPEMMAAALAMQACLAHLRPALAGAGVTPLATVVLGTVKGDLHDIGKDLVGMMLEGAGFQVVNLGVDVPAGRFVEAAREHRAAVVGMSALLTTTMPAMATTIEALKEAGLRDQVKVIVGGAAVTAEVARAMGADAYAPDAGAAVRTTRQLLGLGHRYLEGRQTKGKVLLTP